MEKSERKQEGSEEEEGKRKNDRKKDDVEGRELEAMKSRE